MKILIADDSRTSLAILAATLKEYGHEILAASSARDAIELFKKDRPDLVILDVVMSEMDGFECARQIRLIDSNDWIPIIFLSASIDDEHISKGIDAGGDDYLTKPFSDITLLAKIKAMQRIANMRSELYELTKKLKILAETDPLTHTYNRLQFERILKDKMIESDQSKKPFSLLFIDLDKFKLINDTLGHHMGDLLLKECVRRIKSCLRANDFLARIGGDEFAIIIDDAQDEKHIENISKSIIKALSEDFNLENIKATVGVSIGIAIYPSSSSDEDNLLHHADAAMYHAKRSGGNRYHYYGSKDS